MNRYSGTSFDVLTLMWCKSLFFRMQDFALETQSWPSLGEVKTSPSSPAKKLRPSKENVSTAAPSAAPALLASPVGEVRPSSPVTAIAAVAATGESAQSEPAANGRHNSKSKKKGIALSDR
jgi:hypothetical protein